MSILPPRARPIHYVLEQVAAEFNLRPADLLVHEAGEPIRSIRRAAMSIAQDVTGAGSSEIGRVFERDHTSVISARRKMRAMRREGHSKWLLARSEILIARLRQELGYRQSTVNRGKLQTATVNGVEESACSDDRERIVA